MQVLTIDPKRPATDQPAAADARAAAADTRAAAADTRAAAAPARRWWHEPWMWLVVGGPVLVVLAALATAFVAASDPDRLVEPDYYRRGVQINRTLEPAMRARNAATADAAAGVPATRAAGAGASAAPHAN